MGLSSKQKKKSFLFCSSGCLLSAVFYCLDFWFGSEKSERIRARAKFGGNRNTCVTSTVYKAELVPVRAISWWALDWSSISVKRLAWHCGIYYCSPRLICFDAASPISQLDGSILYRNSEHKNLDHNGSFHRERARFRATIYIYTQSLDFWGRPLPFANIRYLCPQRICCFAF